jgi:AcrR family transcriptional regulator
MDIRVTSTVLPVFASNLTASLNMTEVYREGLRRSRGCARSYGSIADMERARAGRPRDTSIDARVFAVTRALLVEIGWDDLSMRLIAARAKVSRSSLSRRWSSKAELVLHAILGATPDLAPFADTDRRGWVDWVVRGSRELFARPEVRAAVPGLLLAIGENEQLRNRLWESFSGPAVALFVGADSDPAAELEARAVLAMAAGAALFLTTVAVEDDTDALHARIAAILGEVAERSDDGVSR